MWWGRLFALIRIDWVSNFWLATEEARHPAIIVPQEYYFLASKNVN